MPAKWHCERWDESAKPIPTWWTHASEHKWISLIQCLYIHSKSKINWFGQFWQFRSLLRGICSPGMLQSAVSKQLFDRGTTGPKNGVPIAGYAVEHTLAKEIMNQPKEVVTLEGQWQPLNCLVDYVSSSAHIYFVRNRSFFAQVERSALF